MFKIEALYDKTWYPCEIVQVSTKYDEHLDVKGRIFVDIVSTVVDKNDSLWEDCIPHTRLRINGEIFSKTKIRIYSDEKKNARKKRNQGVFIDRAISSPIVKRKKYATHFVQKKKFNTGDIYEIIERVYAMVANRKTIYRRQKLESISNFDFIFTHILLREYMRMRTKEKILLIPLTTLKNLLLMQFLQQKIQ